MLAVPGFTALIIALLPPLFDTVAALLLELVHLRFAAFAYEPAFVFSAIV